MAVIGKADLLEGTDSLRVPLHPPVDPAHLQVHGGDVQGVRWIQFTAQDTKRDHNLLNKLRAKQLCVMMNEHLVSILFFFR